MSSAGLGLTQPPLRALVVAVGRGDLPGPATDRDGGVASVGRHELGRRVGGEVGEHAESKIGTHRRIQDVGGELS